MATVKGLWTKAELAEAHKLAIESEATDARWGFADWLLAKEPVGVTREHNGRKARLTALAADLGWKVRTLEVMRDTARAWPVEHRVPNASFEIHRRYRTGGANSAARRAAEIAASPRDHFGRVKNSTSPRAKPLRTGTLVCDRETWAAVVAEAEAAGQTIGHTATELINEALDARAWLAAEVAA